MKYSFSFVKLYPFIISGVIGLLLEWITPLAIVPTVSLVGLSLFGAAVGMAGSQWGVASLLVSIH